MNKNISSGNKNIDWNISIVISDLNFCHFKRNTNDFEIVSTIKIVTITRHREVPRGCYALNYSRFTIRPLFKYVRSYRQNLYRSVVKTFLF